MPMEETCPPLSDDAIFTPLDNCSTVAAADGPNVPGESSGKPGPTSVIDSCEKATLHMRTTGERLLKRHPGIPMGTLCAALHREVLYCLQC